MARKTTDAPPGDARHAVGRRGEAIAAWYLRFRGYRILARNVHIGRHEIDLIARRGKLVVFVEVRARARADAYAPEDSFGSGKRRDVCAAVRAWLNHHRQPDVSYRIDFIGVIAHRWWPAVRHHADAVRLGD